MGIKTLFEEAALKSKTLTKKPDNDILLQLYSLYKQSTEGDVNIEVPVNQFDFVAKAKFIAWQALKGKSKDAAMQEYIDLIATLK